MLKPKAIAESLEVKPGDYPVEIVDAFEAVSKTSGAEMMTVVLQTTDGQTRVYEHFVHGHPVAARRLMSLLAAVGLADKDQIEARELIGKHLLVRLAVEKAQGMPPQPRVKKFMPANGKVGTE